MKTKLLKKVLLSIVFLNFWIVFAAIPSTYIANYDIEDDREKVSKIFIEIEANNKIGLETSILKFWELNQSFVNLFPKFPQDYDFQVIYQQCLQLSQSLSSIYNYNTFSSFMNNCYKPLSQIMSKINANFTIKANATTKPNNGPAPLTVTFDARTSTDPSNETIPSDNFFWYYRDINGEDKAIWVGPVINHTFEEAGNYIVHLTVRSSNKTTKWIFDWKKTMSIDVKPKAAVISVFANSKKLKKFEKIKFGTQEWQKWIVLDGSATVAVGGRQILSHSREITSKDGFKFTKPGEGSPNVIKVILPKDGEYKIILKTSDNEWNNISEEYFIMISDPVAIIKKDPDQWNTSNLFSFDSSASYSMMSTIKLYTREIFDNKWDKIETFQWKNIRYQFKQPWSYTIKLSVEDELWQNNVETIQAYVDSSNPIAQFTNKPTEKREFPSSFVFDASLSSDVDAENGYDELDYSWSFSNPKATKIIENSENNKIVEVNFDTIWEHTVKLTVKDKFGKVSEIEKVINIKSILRPVIAIAPKAITRGNTINFVVQSNEDILNYTRNFWDWESISTQTNKVTHIYKKMWSYKVTLKVYGANGMENSIVDNVFIWDKNFPIAAYKIIWSSQDIFKQNEECLVNIDWEQTVVNAYKVERYQNFTIDTKDSVNVRWENNNLNYYFQPKNSEIFKNSNFKYSFNELWCQFIDFTVEDLSLGINSKDRIWFKVYNSLPNISNLILYFPQYGNEMWVGFNENQVRDIFNTEFDPLIVKVQATNPVDADGFISYFKWYYYYKDDPSRPIETKITPWNIPYAFFSLPKIPWEFMFGVNIYDSDDWVSYSEKIIWNWPIVFFPPDTKRPDIPMVTLKSDKTSVEVWDEITFDVVSKIISDRSDFVQERTIYYDFDGDGERDLITKNDRVTHVYTEPSDIWYTPRAAVTYRGYKGIGVGGSIVVKKGLKPRLITESAWKFVLFRDVSLWEIEKNNTCLSLLDCKQGNTWFLLNTQKTPVFVFEYPEYQKYITSTDIEDKYANKANVRQTLELTWVEGNSGTFVNYTGDIKLLSIPAYQEHEDGSLEVFVGKNLNNSVAFYILFDDSKNKECYVDLDISDWSEKDFYCNQVFFTKFDPKYESTIWKIYYQIGSQLKSQEIRISFIDFSITLDEKTQVIYEKANKIIKTTTNEGIKALLINLQKWITDPTEVQSNVVALQNYLIDENNMWTLSDTDKESLQWVINELSDSTTISAMWWTEYDLAKSEILQILPSNLQLDIEKLFYEFETIGGNTEQQITQNKQREAVLNKILSMIAQKITKDPETQKPDEITKDDMELIIMPNICKIAQYYEMPSEKCASENTKIVDDSQIKAEKGHRSGLKILLIVLLSFVWLFITIIVVFAVKAKIKQKEEQEENDDEW